MSIFLKNRLPKPDVRHSQRKHHKHFFEALLILYIESRNLVVLLNKELDSSCQITIAPKYGEFKKINYRSHAYFSQEQKSPNICVG